MTPTSREPDIVPLELRIEDPRWAGVHLASIAPRAIDTALGHLGLDIETADLSLLAIDDAAIATLNSDFRGKDNATNVLSWPAQDLAPRNPGGRPDQPVQDVFGDMPLGDIALSYDTCAREARDAGKPLDEHTTHLIIHGLLHLLGYDHIDDQDAALMEGLEIAILAQMGLGDPYGPESD